MKKNEKKRKKEEARCRRACAAEVVCLTLASRLAPTDALNHQRHNTTAVWGLSGQDRPMRLGDEHVALGRAHQRHREADDVGELCVPVPTALPPGLPRLTPLKRYPQRGTPRAPFPMPPKPHSRPLLI